MAMTAEDFEAIFHQQLQVWKDKQNPELSMMAGLIRRHGFQKVEQAISERACFINWPDGEGLGTSDIAIYVNDIVTGLGEPSIFNKE